MKIKRKGYLRNTLLPCLLLSGIAGVLTGALIFLFKICASVVIHWSEISYAFVRNNPQYLPFLILALLLIALLSAFVLSFESYCKGGGIPTSIAILRSLVPFNWIKNIFLLFASAMLTYLGGVPLGNEGPSVQMGTAVGRGTIRLFGKKHQALDRYVMTGGACAGFAAATGAPISGIMFALEEAHHKFSPIIFMTSAIAVIAGQITMTGLSNLFHQELTLFEIKDLPTLRLSYIWMPLIIGAICAIVAILFTKSYSKIFDLFAKKLYKIPLFAKFLVIFAIVGVLGFASAEFIGSGHSLIVSILNGEGLWYMILLYLCVRALLLLFANNAGVTGGIFLPTLAFGAMIGALCGKGMIALNILPQEYYAITIVIGISAFLSASSRTPITAILFAIEALGGFGNVLIIAVGATFAYVIIETLGVKSFTDVMIDSKVKSVHKGKPLQTIDTTIVAQPNSFVLEKNINEILWPPNCVVSYVKKAQNTQNVFIEVGDVLHVHYQTFDDTETTRLLEDIAGKQDIPNTN